jgi:hypothetical protein
MMRALPRRSLDAKSDRDIGCEERNTSSVVPATEELCPLKVAMRDELHALGVSVEEVQQYLRCGDLRNAEAAFGDIMTRVRTQFCPPKLANCDWVREGQHQGDCDLLSDSASPYLHSISTQAPATSTPSNLDDLLEQAMRF